jgi:putative PIN family toxin of toxin-antitoxin system
MSGASVIPAATLDTNLIISGAITPHGIPNRILRALERRAFTLVAAPEIGAEVRDVLHRPKIQERYRPAPAIVQAVLAALRAAEVRPLPLDALPIHCRDRKDDHLLACALGGEADYLVTGDTDLLALDGHLALGRLRIVTPRFFLGLLEDEDPA